ncbi:MAG: hypothetical protein IJ079_09645 [Lachnospiraceae bacterium]|nr:hypothetical protein [Lachnospiraceae bacterium]
MKYKINLIMMMLLSLLLIGGCGKQEITDYNNNTMTIGKDDTIRDVSIEDFANGDYNMQDLEQFVNNEIGKYNSDAGSERITLADFNTDNKVARLQLVYASIEDYNSFNHTEYSLKSWSDSVLTGSLTSVADQQEVPVSEIEDNEYKVLSIDDAMDLVFEGKALYYNSNITARDGVYTANGDGTAVVVFK